MRLACLKSDFVRSLKEQCKIILEKDETPILELEKYISQCKSLGVYLSYEITKVQQKVDLMTKILQILDGDNNYEDRLQSVMTEVFQAKM